MLIGMNSWCGCFRPPGRNVRHGSLYDLQKGLLDALAGNVARDRRILRLARDLVDFVEVDDADFGFLTSPSAFWMRRSNKFSHILAHIPPRSGRWHRRWRRVHGGYAREFAQARFCPNQWAR